MSGLWPLSPPHCAIICSLHFPPPWGGHHQPYNCTTSTSTSFCTTSTSLYQCSRLVVCTKQPHPSPSKHLQLSGSDRQGNCIIFLGVILTCRTFFILIQYYKRPVTTWSNFLSSKIYRLLDIFWHPSINRLRFCALSSSNIVDIHSAAIQ